MKIWFDMDGTIANLYGVENWLDKLISENPSPYLEAKPLINMNRLAKLLNKIQKKGIEIGIISWLSKNSTDEYDKKVTSAKLTWLNTHLKSVNWDYIKIVPYGTNKYELCESGYLFDDEEKNRIDWKDKAYEPNKIFEVLTALGKN